MHCQCSSCGACSNILLSVVLSKDDLTAQTVVLKETIAKTVAFPFQALHMVLQDVDLNCVDLEDALEILAAKLKTKDKRAGKSKAALKRPSAALQKDLSTLEELKPRGDSEPDDRNGQAQTAPTNKTPLELADASQAPAGDNGEEGKGKPKATKPKGKAVAGSKPKVPAKEGKSIVKMASKSKSKTVSKSKNKGKAESSSAGTPKTGYRLFWRQQWDKLKSDDPNIHMTDATKQIANVWQSMDAEAKEQFK